MKNRSRLLYSLIIIGLTITMLISSYFIFDFHNSYDDSFPDYEKRMILNLDGQTNISNLFSPSKNYIYTGNSFYFNNGEDNYYVMQLPIKHKGFHLTTFIRIQNTTQPSSMKLMSMKQDYEILIEFDENISVDFSYNSEILVKLENIQFSDLFDFFLFEVYFNTESIIVKINSNIVEKKVVNLDIDLSILSIFSFSSNLEVQTVTLFTYLCKQDRTRIFIAFSELIIENTMFNLQFQFSNGSFISGYDAYGKDGYELVSSSLMLVKMFQTFELTNNFSLLPIINKTVNFLLNESLVDHNEYGYFFNDGTSLINDVARPLFGLLYIALTQSKHSIKYFPQIESYLDKFILSKMYDFENHYWYSNSQKMNSVINQQMQASTLFYLWAKYRNFDNITTAHNDFIAKYLIPSQQEDGCWFYSLNTQQPMKPLFIVYTIHNLYNLALMKHFYPSDSLWKNPLIEEMLSNLIPWMEEILPSFAYFADYYSNLDTINTDLSTNSDYENEPHHILGYASLGYFSEYGKKNMLDWGFQAFFDTFVTLNIENFRHGARLSSNFLSDALSYRWFLFKDLQKKFHVFV